MTTKDLIKKYSHIFGTRWYDDIDCEGAWLFTEGAGETVADSSKNSNVATFKGVGEPVWSAVVPAAYCDYSVDYEGTDDYIAIPANASLDNAHITYVGWFRNYDPVPFDKNRFAYNKKNTLAGTVALVGLSGESKIKAQIRLDGTEATGRLIVADDNDDGAWHYYGITYDGDDFIMLVDGVEQADVLSMAGSIDTDNSNTLVFGGHSDLGLNWKGLQAETASFKRALDSTEINSIKDIGLAGEIANPYPIAWLKKKIISGYHCFMNQYMRSKVLGYDPLKLPNGTVW